MKKNEEDELIKKRGNERNRRYWDYFEKRRSKKNDEVKND